MAKSLQGVCSLVLVDADVSCSVWWTQVLALNAANPNRMSIMKSGTRRFHSQPSHLVTPFGVYQLDTAHKKSLSTGVRGTVSYALGAESGLKLLKDVLDFLTRSQVSPCELTDCCNLFLMLLMNIADTKRFYAAPFYAKTRSTSCGDAKSAGPGCSYDVQALTSGQAPTFQECIAQSPILYTVMRCAPAACRIDSG